MAEKKGIYRHVVLFQFNDNATPAVVEGIENAFREMCKKLAFVEDFEWGKNTSTENLNDGFTHCFIVTFSDPDGRDRYLPHPDHQAFCRQYLDSCLKKVCVLDFVSND